MDHPLNALSAWTRDVMSQSSQSVSRWGTTLATWLVLGNAGALVIAISGMVTGANHCDATLLVPALWMFALGLIAAFAGGAINFAAGLYMSWLIGKSARYVAAMEWHGYQLHSMELRNQTIANDAPARVKFEEAAAADKALLPHLKWGYVTVAISYVVSLMAAALFVAGLMTPILDNGRLITSCQYG